MNNLGSSEKVNTLLYGNKNLGSLDNKSILNAKLEFIRYTPWQKGAWSACFAF